MYRQEAGLLNNQVTIQSEKAKDIAKVPKEARQKLKVKTQKQVKQAESKVV